jgi:heptosyltransferase III
MRRILVIRGGAIGDFVLTLPAIKLLRDEYPDAQLEILGYRHIIALAENRGYANATRSIEYGALASFFGRGTELPRELSDYFRSFDLVVSYLFDPDGIFGRNLDRAGVDILLAGNPKISGDKHAAVQLAEPLRELELSLGNPAAVLFPNPADESSAAEFLQPAQQPIVALHPGSGSDTKNWPLQRWQELGDLLLNHRDAGTLLVIGGEADQRQLRELEQHWRGRSVVFAENLPLTTLAAVLQQCAVFIGHDSGISHIAAAAGAPCVLLFGPTDPAVWAPQNEQVQVLRATTGMLPDISAGAVHQLAAQKIARS